MRRLLLISLFLPAVPGMAQVRGNAVSVVPSISLGSAGITPLLSAPPIGNIALPLMSLPSPSALGAIAPALSVPQPIPSAPEKPSSPVAAAPISGENQKNTSNARFDGAVEALRGTLPFVDRVGPDVSAEITLLRKADNELSQETKRLEAAGRRLPPEEVKAVRDYESISYINTESDDAESAGNVSHFYAQKVEGLLGSVKVELRARLAAALYARLRLELPAGMDDKTGYRIVRRMMAHRGVEELSARQLARLLEVNALEDQQRALHEKREAVSRPARQLGYTLTSLKRRADTLQRAKTDDWYRTAFNITPEDAERELPGLPAQIEQAQSEYALEQAKTAPELEEIEARLQALEVAERALFAGLQPGLFDDYNSMRGALLMPDKVGSCCGKGCWDCPLSAGALRNNNEEFFEGLVPVKVARPPLFKLTVVSTKGPAPDLVLYRVQATLRAILPYLGD